MARMTAYSVTDLEKMLDRQRNELSKLEARRDRLSAELADCDARISELNGTGAAPGRKPAKRTSKKVARKKAGGAKRGTKRARNQPSLRQVIMDIVPSSKKPMSLDEVMEQVLGTGYRSNAANFRQVVYLNLYNLAKKGDLKHDSKTKLYTG